MFYYALRLFKILMYHKNLMGLTFAKDIKMTIAPLLLNAYFLVVFKQPDHLFPHGEGKCKLSDTFGWKLV